VHIQIRHQAATSAGSPSATDVTVFAGGSKSWWPRLAPGHTVSVVLPPEGESDLTLTYDFSGEKRVWRGAALQRGSSHDVRILIGPDGKASGQQCVRPCQLPP
jgi:hypothetical protein